VIVLLYGREFAAAESAVRVFVVASVAAAVVNPYTHVIYALGAHRRFVPVVLLRFALYLGLLAVLVPATIGGVAVLGLGETGAALARVFAVAFPAWVYVRWTAELAGIGFERRTVVYVAGFALAVVVFHVVAALVAPVGPAGATALAATTGALVYATWLRARHPGSPQTLAYCLDLVRPRW
jgi:O-antigen/teichoic acid export membrane protein